MPDLAWCFGWERVTDVDLCDAEFQRLTEGEKLQYEVIPHPGATPVQYGQSAAKGKAADLGNADLDDGAAAKVCSYPATQHAPVCSEFACMVEIVMADVQLRGPGAPHAQAAAIGKGTRVEIKGLVGKPELNGQHGTVTGALTGNGRWGILLDSGAGIAARPANLAISSTTVAPARPPSHLAGPLAVAAAARAKAAAAGPESVNELQQQICGAAASGNVDDVRALIMECGAHPSKPFEGSPLRPM